MNTMAANGLRMPIEESFAEAYAAKGYAVMRNVISRAAIDKLLTHFRQDIVPSRYPFFRQNTNAYESNKLTAHGYVRQAFLDIHDYASFPAFSAAAREIYCGSSMMTALRQTSGFDAFALMQTMLFDMNTETQAHQDWYYLDSVPKGNLIAAWIALEDIDSRAGRFYVLPKSHLIDFGAGEPGRTHAQWLAMVRAHVEQNRDAISAPELHAGDVLFWNSRTVHGSLPTRDPAFSRKSLTAHYLPREFQFGNLFSVKSNLAFKYHQNIPFYRNQPDYSRWNRLKFAVKTRAYNHPRVRETLRKVRDAFSGARSA